MHLQCIGQAVLLHLCTCIVSFWHLPLTFCKPLICWPAKPCISSTKLIVELYRLGNLWRSCCFSLMLGCLAVCLVPCRIVVVVSFFYCFALRCSSSSNNSLLFFGLISESVCLHLWLLSTAVSDQTQVVCFHQTSISGGGTGSHPSSTSPAGISACVKGTVSHSAGPSSRQVGSFW